MAERKKPSLVEIGALEAEAAAWVSRLDAGPSDELLEEFQRWMDQSRHHREAGERLRGLWGELDALAELRASAVEASATARRPVGRAAPQRRLVAAMVAAAAALAAVVGLAVAVRPPAPAPVFETAVGEQRTIALADGSTVQLNTNSRLQVQLAARARDLRLERGEAFFQVKHDPARPFTVYAGQGTVQALGTAFAVRLEKDEMRVTLTRGAVRLGHAAPAGFRPTRPRQNGDEAVLTAHGGRVAEAVVAPNGITQQPVSSEAAARELAWRQGALVFADEPLSHVVADVSRYTDVDIEIADPKLRDVRIAGYFQTGEVEPMLEALQTGFGIHVERLGPKRVRLSAAAP